MLRIRRECVLLSVLLVPVVAGGQVASDAEVIARAMVIGQAYVSGNVYVAGFIDDEPRPWPRQIEGVPLEESRRERIAADFFRAVVQDSEEHYTFPQREGDPAEFSDDLFSTLDRMAVQDRNLARYRAPAPVDRAVAFLGWDARMPLADISYRQSGQPRPIGDGERKQVADARKQIPKDFECSTEPQYLDAAKVILTAAIAKPPASIRLSKYLNPGCAGHLSEIYVLDVITPNASRRFEFRHYHGLL